ncbi:hypothetical protein O53_3441 [Microcystis aeruginosa TAIHU98]|uniref:Uncharacterized protein n=1 Tax=Microcystis aeruginosa TAIHU98 TaxID=1134457 RepID=L7E8N2_MICAE|nr:hypothetical protein O53_3441 [Microcystis aeruginosa TAIHU98]
MQVITVQSISQPSGLTLATGQVLLVPERAFKEGYQIST